MRFKSAAGGRWIAASTLLVLSFVAAPVMAQSCNATPQAKLVMAAQDADEGATVVLDATPSSPAANHPQHTATFAWSGPIALVRNSDGGALTPTTRVVRFTAPEVGSAGQTLTFNVRVTCGTKNDRGTQVPNFEDVVATVRVRDVVSNVAPTAVATVSPALIREGDLVTLDGRGSYDIDNTPTTSGLSYLWTQIGDDGQPVVGGVSFNQPATSALVTFTAPNTPTSVNGTTLKFRLRVSDGALADSIDKLVTVTWLNDAPFAHVACPLGGIVVPEHGEVVLDGSGSFDLDDGIASYFWQQVNGTPDTGTTGTATAVLRFNAPALSLNEFGILNFELVVRDHTGDSAKAECAVVINDVTAPVISAQGNITAEAESADGAEVSFSIYAQDAAEDLAAYPIHHLCAPPSGHLFPLGTVSEVSKTTGVACEALDGKGNRATREFDVTVKDTTPPTFTAPGSYAVEATGPDGATVNYGVIATADSVDGPAVATCSPSAGSVFPIDTTTVTCNASDARGNAADPQSFELTVHDTTPPVIERHDDIGPLEATGPGGRVVTYTSPATFDLVDLAGVATCTPASGSTFGLGANTVACNATDAAGNAALETEFTITIEDTTAPTVTVPADIIEEATSAAGAAVSFTASAFDLVDEIVDASCDPASGSTFSLGDTRVNCSATDLSSNEGHASFKVTVVDTTAPVIAPRGDILGVEATGPSGAGVSYDSPATSDAVDGPGTASCAPASGSTFALGLNTVTCNASDAAGNAAGETTFNIEVVDTTPPTFASYPADISAAATSNMQAAVAFALPTASDLVDGPVTVSCDRDSGSSFALGSTTVNCRAEDARGNVSTMSFVVKIGFSWSGFLRPVDNLPTINVVQAGSAIPVKFNLGGNQGLGIFATGYPNSASMSCGSGPTDVIAASETVTAGGSSLQFDATTGQYNYVWKTEKSWASSCRVLQLTLKDGTVHRAMFQFKK